MTDAALLRALRSVGLAAFVDHLDLFQAATDTATRAQSLHLRTGWALAACKTRVNTAGAILKAGRLRDALGQVAAAEKVAPEARRKARQMLAA